MSKQIKHVGRMISDNRPVVIVFRTIPGEHESALVVFTDTITHVQYEELNRLVLSSAGQDSFELGEVMFRTMFQDGSLMLQKLNHIGKLTKVKTADVEVTPGYGNPNIKLSELNDLIAKGRNVSVERLAYLSQFSLEDDSKKDSQEDTDIVSKQSESDKPVEDSEVYKMTSEELAKKYRSDAMRMSREAAALRRMAEELHPTVKRSSNKKQKVLKSNTEQTGLADSLEY